MKTLYKKISDGLVNDGYIIIEDALSSELSKQLTQTAENQTHYKEAGISSSDALHLDKNRRRDKIAWLNEDGACVSEFLSFADTLREYLNRS